MRCIDTLVALVLTAALPSCAPAPTRVTAVDPYQPEPYVQIQTPEWAKSATIYQLNTRQFTPEGTFRAAQAQLPRLKALGADIIWLMPIHEIGIKNRKGTLGSPYSVKDYFSVNPEFGSEADLRSFRAGGRRAQVSQVLRTRSDRMAAAPDR
jgi:maltooligosyltrehalose synthase